jgi:predicted nucleotidyltransferase
MKREFKAKFKGLGISTVYLFGSSVTGTKRRSSDIDIGVVFKNPPLGRDNRATYNSSYRLFSE